MYWVFWPYHVLEVYNVPFPTDKTVQEGHYLTYESKFCVFDSVPVTVSQQLVSDEGVELPPTTLKTKVPKGCYDKYLTYYIPVGIEPRKYKLKNTGEWQVNPFRSIEFHTETQLFNIIK